MRNMSFALTTQQIIDGTKTVTRRMGWLQAKPGQLIRPVRKCMGLRQGEKLEPLRGPLRIISVRREPLREMTSRMDYGFTECVLEGFPLHWPSSFIEMFCDSHKGCTPDTIVTRIEFTFEVVAK